MAFLTLEDPNAGIKGSRDPLGVQPIWATFGRHVVTNLTTQSTSIRGFTILLLGRYFAARLIGDGVVPEEEALNVALRMEQLGAHARYAAHDVEEGIRGIERVKAFIDEGRGKVTIQANRRGMILSDQKVYGLWGLYSVPARTSGLISEGRVGVEEPTRKFIEQNYLPYLEEVMSPLRRLLARGGTVDTRGKDPVFTAVAKVLPEKFTQNEIEFYGHYLRDGLEVKEADSERQSRFRELLETHTDLDQPVGRGEILRLAKAARSTDESLAHHLERITHLEALLAMAEAMFDYILTQNGKHPKDVAANLSEHWGHPIPNLDSACFQEILPEIKNASTPEIGSAMVRCHEALRVSNYEEAVRTVLDWNAKVMAGRNSAPWAAVGEEGWVNVRYRGSERFLPKRNELSELWENNYFIDSLKNVCRQLGNGN